MFGELEILAVGLVSGRGLREGVEVSAMEDELKGRSVHDRTLVRASAMFR